MLLFIGRGSYFVDPAVMHLYNTTELDLQLAVRCRVQYHPMVVRDPPGVRFYAVAPLVTSTGFRIGAL